MKKIIFLLIILVQFLTIGVLLKDINKKKALGTVSVNPLPKDTITSSNSGKLKYFYEPTPNIVIKADPIFQGLENVSYTINKDGLNQRENYSISKPKDVYRIVILGDSFTFGQNVNTDDNYPSQISKLLNQKVSCSTIREFQVLNLGMAGYDIQYAVERYKLRGKAYNPDLIIWLIIDAELLRVNEYLRPKVHALLESARIMVSTKKILKREYIIVNILLQ